jgi:hypothetical protein
VPHLREHLECCSSPIPARVPGIRPCSRFSFMSKRCTSRLPASSTPLPVHPWARDLTQQRYCRRRCTLVHALHHCFRYSSKIFFWGGEGPARRLRRLIKNPESFSVGERE